MTFEMGTLTMTKGIGMAMHEDVKFARFVIDCYYHRYRMRDWGDLGYGDKKMNDAAIKNSDDRIFARYNNPNGDIYIITEWDRSVTTILFTDEY